MNAQTLALLAGAALAALIDWWAVHRSDYPVERLAKPATLLFLIGVAAVAGDAPGGVRAALVAGAVLGLAGDVALLGRTEAQFMAGLAAFALGHLAYAAAAAQVAFDWRWALVGAVVMVAMLAFRFVSRILPGAARVGGNLLGGAVACYGAVISATVVSAWAMVDAGGAAWLAPVGAMSFAASDWVLGHQRFAGPLPCGRLAVMVPYHVGQALLIVGVALGG